MAIFAIKLLNNVRKAIAGRNHPHQLAWAVGLGVILGLVPHGNLVAVAILLVIVITNINHAMAAVATVVTTFVASQLDPVSDQVGQYVLTNETTGPMVASAWQWPLVPWTDLNNTVVMGSLVIGLAAMIPVVMITYPIFRWLSSPLPAENDPNPAQENVVEDTEAVQQSVVPAPHFDEIEEPVERTLAAAATTSSPEPTIHSVDQYLAGSKDYLSEQNNSDEPEAVEEEQEEDYDDSNTVDTRIDVIRMTDYRKAPDTDAGANSQDDEPMDEALSYLLRQLRDSQQRKAG